MNFDFFSYIDSAFLVIPVVCYALGMILKATPRVKNWMIPYFLLGAAILLCGIYRFTTGTEYFGEDLYVTLVQGVLCAAVAVFANQVYKQTKVRDEN